MILTEDYCSRAVVDALAAKGAFDIIPKVYVDGQLVVTHQMAMKWLRDVKGLMIHPTLIDVGNHNYKWDYFVVNISDPDCDDNFDDEQFETYEQAVEDAIKYCLT